MNLNHSDPFTKCVITLGVLTLFLQSSLCVCLSVLFPRLCQVNLISFFSFLPIVSLDINIKEYKYILKTFIFNEPSILQSLNI